MNLQQLQAFAVHSNEELGWKILPGALFDSAESETIMWPGGDLNQPKRSTESRQLWSIIQV